MTLARSEREWAILVSEFNVCKKKLNSKREALKILTSDLELCQRERDIYKTKIKQLLKEAEESKRKEKEREKEDQNKVAKTKTQSPERSQGHKRERRCSGNTLWEQELQHIRERKQKTLSQLLCDSRGENKALQKDLADLRQLYYDAQEDIQLLRESLARQKNSIKIKDGAENSIDPRQDLISQLEKDQEKMSELERDIQALSDEKSEIATERDHFRDKSERLNTQLNFILGADDRRLVDIDSVLMENRYLKEQIKQLKEEKTMAVSSLNRYKNTFEKRKNKILQAQYQGSYSSMAKHAVPSLFSELLGNLSSSTSPSTVADLQLLANSLSETLSEKDTALQHLRSANKILGHRVAELEKKLKTLEVSGLWSLQGHRGYGSTAADKLSKERIYYKGHLLMTEDDAPSNDQHEGDASSEDVGRTSEPDSPASPGSPTLQFSPFQGVVEEGVLVNVAGSPGVVLDELEGVELLDSGSDDEANHLSDNLSPPPAARKSLKEDFAEASQLNKRDCSAAREESPQEGSQTDEFCDFTTYGDTKVLHAEESSPKPSPPGLDNHTARSPEQTIGNGTRVSDTELSPFLKRVGSSDEG